MRRNRTIAWLLVLLVLLGGCGARSLLERESKAAKNMPAGQQKPEPNRYFIKKVAHREANDYIVCYGSPEGESVEIVNIGQREQPLTMVNGRIYYATGISLISVNLQGKDQKILNPNKSDTFETVTGSDENWVYCAGTRQVEILGDPVALDGVHHAPAEYRVAADFSSYEEVDG
jgi:hypothetical protein